MAHLRFPHSDKAPVTLGDKLVIGRSADHADLVIDDKRLSRRHCELLRTSGGYLVRDLASANGIRINNGDKVGEARLNDGDQISLGGYLLSFHSGDPEPDGNRAILRVIKGSLSKVTFQIDPVPFTIGRKENCEMVLEGDAQASGHHARILRNAAGEWTVIDLGSTNGTKVDGRAIREAVLNDGAQIAVGSALLRFQLVREGAEPSPGIIDSGMAHSGGPNAATEFFDPRTKGIPGVMPDAATSRMAKADVEELDLGGSDSDSDSDGTPDSQGPMTRVNSQGSGAGRKVVLAAEVVVAAVILAAVVFFLMQLMERTGEGGPATTGADKIRPAPRDGGGLLRDDAADGRGNYSFELDDPAATAIPGWTTVESSPYDMVMPLRDDGRTGGHVLRIQRFQATPQRTVAECQRFVDVTPGKAYTASVWHRRPTGQGSAFLTMRWFTAKGEAAPVRSDSLGFTPGGGEWQQLSVQFVAPPGARAAKFGVGYAGLGGELLFDTAGLAAAEGTPQTGAIAGSDVVLRLDGSGRIMALSAQGQVMLTQGHFLLTSSAAERPPLSHIDWLVSAPAVTDDAWTFPVFDPDTETVRNIVFRPKAGGFEIEASAPAGSGYGTVVFRTQATQAMLPEGSQVALFERNQMTGWGTDFATTGAAVLRVTDSQACAEIRTSAKVRQRSQMLDFFLAEGRCTVDLAFPGIPAAQRERLAMVRRETEMPVTNAGRLTAGIGLAVEGVLDGEALRAATEAVEGSQTEWRIREKELGNTVDAGAASARDAQRFLAAVDEADALSEVISAQLAEWRASLPKIHELARLNSLPEDRRTLLMRISRAVEGLGTVRDDLVTVKRRGDAQAFLLRAERQRIAAQPLLASALDHFATAEPVQAQIKFEAVIDAYPHTRAATTARLRLCDLAAALLAERDQYTRAGLPNMAKESRAKAEKIVALVRSTSAALDFDRVIERLKAGGTRRPPDVNEWELEQRQAMERVLALEDAIKKGK